MRYDFRTGVQRAKSNTKKYIIGAVGSVLMVGGAAVPTMAAGPSDNSQASPCGATHGAFANENGNFGFLGELGGTPGYHNSARGQEPGATGYNNSHTNCQEV